MFLMFVCDWMSNPHPFAYKIDIILVFNIIILLPVLVNRCFAGREINNHETSLHYRAHKIDHWTLI